MATKEEEKLLDRVLKGEKPVYNRAQRRRKLPTDNIFTKATHRIKKIRSKNVPTKQQRQRAIAKARKARKESYSQVS